MPLRGQIEEMIGSVQHVDATRVGRVSVKYIAVLVFVEGADALAFVDVHLGFGEIVKQCSALNFLRRERHMIIKVEIVFERRKPLELPSHPLLESGKFLQRRARNEDQVGVALPQVNQGAIVMIDPK